MTPAIEVRDLVKDYGGQRALAGIGFRVERGEFVGLLGPNGAGKSTTLNILAGLTRPSSGEARVFGHDVVGEFRLARRNLGVVPQELSYESFFTVTRALRWQAGYHGLRRVDDWIEELLHRLHLWDQRDKTGRQLSGGMKRRLLVAKALVHRPPVVILDEPTAGVDVELRRELWAFIRDLHASGTTVLLTTHYLEEAEELCDRIAILGEGRILALERTATLLARHTDRQYVLYLAEPEPTPPPALEPFVCRVADEGRRLVLQASGEERRAALWDAVRSAGLAIQDVEVLRPNLEDVFLEITHG
ncbi:MAG: ABC transporter ATP-binding protein [Planctomycetota bacterium]